ncbi:hypothetical protein H7I41_08435 [Mycobacterium manitobense]|uniref:Uncharacterized protein n=2 Tax=[Mycobacterium] manitobense TaxID=190147 RepID=A0A9X2YL67_9MYCO|nr:hypothetical protein [[Mycobacterium] manitobense]
MIWMMGGWGNRQDELQSCALRLQRSIRLAPSEPDLYGQWGVLQPQQPDSRTGEDLRIVPIDVDDVDALERIIVSTTEAGSAGPRTGPGHYIDLVRDSVSPASEESATTFKYTVRAGFTDMPRPYNHIFADLRSETDERTLMGYMSALVQAWNPDHLGAVSRRVKREQGHRPPEVVVGRLTYIRGGTPLNTSALGDEIDVAAADGGHYIRVPGTPEQPSVDHIRRVRQALGYAGS